MPTAEEAQKIIDDNERSAEVAERLIIFAEAAIGISAHQIKKAKAYQESLKLLEEERILTAEGKAAEASHKGLSAHWALKAAGASESMELRIMREKAKISAADIEWFRQNTDVDAFDLPPDLFPDS